MLKFFRLPFATTGDKTAVPDAVDSNGNVSYSQGYGFDYQRQKTDPAAKNIERDKMNQVFFDMTTAIAELQSQGVPDFITTALNGGTAYSYAQYAVVKYSGDLYISLVAANTALPSDATKWALLPTPARIQSAFNSSAVAAGTADALTGAFTPAIAALPASPGTLSVLVRAGAANATTTPTFKADGTTAKTIVKGNNLPLAAGDIAGAGHWLEMNFDTVLDKWVLQNPTYGFGVTPAQFDNTTKAATTAFVQRALGNNNGVSVYNADATIPASGVGKLHVPFASANYTLTIPAASGVPAASSLDFLSAQSAGNFTIIQPASGQILIPGSSGVAFTKIGSADNLKLVSDGANWQLAGGTPLYEFSAAFAKGMTANGYQKLPSGLLIQWVSVATAAGGTATATLPVTFPNGILKAFSSAQGTNSVSTVGVATASTVGVNCFVGNTGAGKAENVSVLAIGY